MEQIRNSVVQAKDLVLGTGPSQSKTEPPSGVTGSGTADQPYDQGNAPEAAANQPAEPKPIAKEVEEATGVPLTKVTSPKPGTPYDIIGGGPKKQSVAYRGSALPEKASTQPEAETIKESTEKVESAQQTPTAPAISTTTSSGLTADGGNVDTAKAGADKKEAEPEQPPTEAKNEDRGRSLRVPAGSRAQDHRDVSPGTLDDGTHAVTSGDRGESYEPGKMNRLKGKLFGKH